MTTPRPTVSISLVTYNHKKYIAESIRSILNQTFTDLELVVVDDGSTDGTPEVIASFDDPRIHSIRQKNGGPGAATNRALDACRGRYVALMSGDDVAVPHRIQTQLDEYVRSGPGMLFSACDFIDDDSRPLPGGHFADRWFDVTPRSRPQFLRRFFESGNFINGVTGFTETRILREMGPYEPSLFQVQDFEMWIRVVKKYPLVLMREPLLHYRVRADGGNLSAPSRASDLRSGTEFFLVMRDFFRDVPASLFREAFADRLRRPDLDSPASLCCEQAFLYLFSPGPWHQLIGVEQFHALYRNAETAVLLADEYQFPVHEFVSFLGEFDHRGVYREVSILYVDTGQGFTEKERCVLPVLHLPRFQLRVDLSGFPTVKALRWDPVEGHFCRVRLRRAYWTDTTGSVHELNPAELLTNGVLRADGSYEFETNDPLIHLPVSGGVKVLTLEGDWTIADSSATLARAYSLWRQSEQQACERIQALQHTLGHHQQENTALREQAAGLRQQLERSLDQRLRRWIRAHLQIVDRLARRMRHSGRFGTGGS